MRREAWRNEPRPALLHSREAGGVTDRRNRLNTNVGADTGGRTVIDDGIETSPNVAELPCLAARDSDLEASATFPAPPAP